MNIGSFRRTFSAVRFAMNDIGLWRVRKKPIDEILSLLPTVHGAWPQSGDGVQLFAACDPIYFDRHVDGLVNSINANSPSTSLHLHLYNPTTKQFEELERFQRNMSEVHLTWTWENVRIDGMHRRWKNIHLASLRFPRLYMALNSSARPILSIDIDCFVRRNLSMFMDEARGADIGLVLRSEFRDPGKRVLALAVYAAPTATGISMLGAAASRIAAHIAGRWATENWIKGVFRWHSNRIRTE